MVCAGAVCAVLGGVLEAPAHAGVPPYSLVGSYQLPVGATTFDVMPDGRLVALRGGEILTQDGVNSGSFSALGSVDPAIFDGLFGNFGASFVSLSPDGSTLAIGDNNALNRVHLLDFAALGGDPLVLTHTTIVGGVANDQAHWVNGSTLMVTGGLFGSPASVTRITAPTLTSITVAQVISNIDGASGGVTSDGTYLYTSNGFASATATSTTGEVRVFLLTDLLGSAATPIDFEASGIPVAHALSASSLGFDALGNMLIGGGDFLGEQGFVSVVDQSAIAVALIGGPIAPDSAELRLTPAGATDFYNVRFNDFTQEILITAFGSSAVYRYAVPAPGVGVGLLMGGGLFALRRRRVAA